jgi:nucleotide-binding universal stress UspA family protein
MTERRSLASTTRPTQDEPVSERRADAPAPYQGFDGQYINGSWRPGRHGGVRVDTDPYSGATLAETVMANQGDLDEAYHADIRAEASAMPIAPKTITVFLDTSPSGLRRAIHAAALAQRWGSHIVGVHVVFAGVTLPPSMSYAIGHKAIHGVFAYEEQLDAAAEAAAAVVREHFRSLCFRLDVRGEFRPIVRRKAVEEAILNSLHSDLVVVGHPEPHGLPDEMSPERMLRTSGVPLLILPNAWEGETIGDKILIGWNASRAARRAISDAMTFLVAAKSVTVLVIDPVGRPQHGEEPGADIALHLARHGAYVQVERITANGAPIAQIMLCYAGQSASDLLVVGAYSRLRELLLGGATRTLLTQMPVPVLISR